MRVTRRHLFRNGLAWALTVGTVAQALANEEQEMPGYTMKVVDVPFPGATHTVVTGLTPDNIEVGIYQDAEGNTQGWMRERRGMFVTLLLTVAPGHQSVANHYRLFYPTGGAKD